jgi:Domain of unknown function (DUF4132)
MGWTSATDGYEVSLVADKIVARRSGTVLKALPKQLKDHDAVMGLRQLAEWLGRHDAECRRTVDDWLIRSLPVPASVIVSVWPDDSWRAALSGLVVVPVEGDGWDDRHAGFLRDVDIDGRLGVIDLDGESRWWSPERVVVPHPVVLADVEDLREFASELAISQGVLQLFREIWRKPSGDKELALAAGQYAGGRYEQLRHLTSRAASLGYAVRGGYATVRLWDAGRLIDARVWVGADDPSVETETGDVEFVTALGGSVPMEAVGAVAWSEGLRMAAALYAGRVVEKEAA